MTGLSVPAARPLAMRRSVLLLVVLLAALGFRPLHAQDARLEGAFVYAPEASEDVEAAIDAAVDDLNFIVRPIARRRLRDATEPIRRVTFEQRPGTIVISTGDAANPTRTAPDGTPAPWTRTNGETVDVATRWDGDMLFQTFDAEDGMRTNAYTLSADGDTLRMAVTIRSPRLPEPVEYTLVYRRTS